MKNLRLNKVLDKHLKDKYFKDKHLRWRSSIG